MKEDELEELRELNKHLQTLLKEKDENANILRHNFNVNQYLLLTMCHLKVWVIIYILYRRSCKKS